MKKYLAGSSKKYIINQGVQLYSWIKLFGNRKNKRGSRNLFVCILGIVWAITVLGYIFFVREWVRGISRNLAPYWFIQLVEIVYPRFNTEKHRFPADFFLEKADQVILRFSLLALIIGVGYYLYYFNKNFATKLGEFWNQKMDKLQVERLRMIYSVITCYLVWDWILILNKLSLLSGFYEPVFLLRLLGWGFPPMYVCLLLYGGLILSLLLLLSNRWVVISASVIAFTFIIIQGYFFSFHKIDHTYATYNYAVCCMPLLLYQRQIALKKGLDVVAAWPLLLIRIGVATAYLMAGLEKILIGKIAWFYPQTLIFYLNQHESILYHLVSQYPVLATVLSILVVIFEISFVGILFLPKYSFFFLACGFIFHLSTYFFLGVGGLLSPWILVYVFYIPWENISFQFIQKNND
ncbi:MAG: hypothetical protein NW226_00855 [Microscillaceae bacterium]|nr:hypothetical protein [Microscillaceae bacterium]